MSELQSASGSKKIVYCSSRCSWALADLGSFFFFFFGTFLIDISCGPIRKEAGPGEREAVVRQSKLLDTFQVFFPQFIAVAGHVTRLRPTHATFLMTKCVPDAWTLAVRLPTP